MLSRIERVEAKFNGTDWIKLINKDLTDFKFAIGSETDITAHFSNDQDSAYYDILRKAITIYSGTITSVTSGLKIWLNTFPADLTTMSSSTDMSVDPSTTTHGFPRELHGVLADGIIIDYKGSKEKPLPLTERELVYDRDVEKAIQALKKADYDREIIGSVPYNDGSEY